jgi:steroid delta-isomerase-like uncharacterized protein
MSIKENEVLALRYVDGYTTGEADDAEEFIGPNAKILVPQFNQNGKYGLVPFATGPQEYQAMIRGYHTSFPDVTVTVEDLIVTEDKVGIMYTIRGTFESEFQGVAPTGKIFEYSGVEWIEFAEGKISQVISVFDQMGFFQQLGILPT